MDSTLDTLGTGSYALLTTYRRDGTAVPTALWVVRDGDALAMWTVTGSAKVKRLRRNATVLIGPCTLRGEPTGDPVLGHATLLGAEDTERVRALIRRKYGLMGRFTLWTSRLRRGREGTIGIRIALTPS